MEKNEETLGADVVSVCNLMGLVIVVAYLVGLPSISVVLSIAGAVGIVIGLIVGIGGK